MPLTVPGMAHASQIYIRKAYSVLRAANRIDSFEGSRTHKFVVLCDRGGGPHEPSAGGCEWELWPKWAGCAASWRPIWTTMEPEVPDSRFRGCFWRSCWQFSPVRSGVDPIPEKKRGQTIGVC